MHITRFGGPEVLDVVDLDKELTERRPDEPWEQYYARRLAEHFA